MYLNNLDIINKYSLTEIKTKQIKYLTFGIYSKTNNIVSENNLDNLFDIYILLLFLYNKNANFSVKIKKTKDEFDITFDEKIKIFNTNEVFSILKSLMFIKDSNVKSTKSLKSYHIEIDLAHFLENTGIEEYIDSEKYKDYIIKFNVYFRKENKQRLDARNIMPFWEF